jgi:hypothetical protein
MSAADAVAAVDLTALSMTFCAYSVANSLAMAASRVTRAAPCPSSRRRVDQQCRRIESSAISDARLHHLQVGQRAANNLRSRARPIAYRARGGQRPAAPTVVRKTSWVAMAMQNPRLVSITAVAGRASSNLMRASG